MGTTSNFLFTKKNTKPMEVPYREQKRIEGYLTIDTAIRENEPELASQGYVLLASNNIFDPMTRISNLYLQSQGPWDDDLWESLCKVSGPGAAGILAHITRLQMSQGMPQESIDSLFEAITDCQHDEDVLEYSRLNCDYLPPIVADEFFNIIRMCEKELEK